MQKSISLEEWDKRVAPYLQTIEATAGIINKDAQKIIDWCELIGPTPTFDTRARSNLDTAIASLESALSVLKVARKTYDEKQENKDE